MKRYFEVLSESRLTLEIDVARGSNLTLEQIEKHFNLKLRELKNKREYNKLNKELGLD